MNASPDSLPDDIGALRALALKAIAERDAALSGLKAMQAEKSQVILERDAERAEREKLQSLYDHVRHLLRKANAHRFGARSEKLERLPADQLQLALEDLEAGSARNEALKEKKQPSLRLQARRKRG